MPPPRRPRTVSSAGGRLQDPSGATPPGGPSPMQPGAAPGGPRGPMQGGRPVGPQVPGQEQGIRGMANEQYRNALLRRAQGGASAGAPQQPVGAPPGPPDIGGPPQQGAGNPADLLQNLLRTRTSRRVLGGGGT